MTVNSAVGYLFKFHIKTISGKGEVDREDKREREEELATVESRLQGVQAKYQSLDGG